MRRARRTAALTLATAGLCAGLLSGCVSMPTGGPVVESPESGSTDTLPGIYFDPKPPQPGESAQEIVSHFLEAMKATPIKTSVARQFLTRSAQESWVPERGIVTYAEMDEPIGESTVTVDLDGVSTYDARGAWEGTVAGRAVTFSLTQEDGEWRIDEVPDALIVPASWFGDWFRRVSLYLFDPSAEILVPEPVYVPEGDQFASALVRGLLSTPAQSPRISQTFFPPGLTLLSVPISSAGVADVPLAGDPDVVDELTAQRMLTQLIWTLRQEPRIRAVRLTVGDLELGTPGGATQVNLDVGSAYDPNGSQSTGDLFGLLDGRLVRGSLGALLATPGPLGTETLGVRSIGVNLAGSRVAGVSGDGGSLLLAPVEDPEGRAVQVVSGATDLLPPAWDHKDRIWLVDRSRTGARVLLVVDGRTRVIEVPGVSGARVREVLVSRDGTRLVAAVRTRKGDRLVSARVLHDQGGRVLRATRARPLALDDTEPVLVRDIAWRTPTTVSVLTDITDDLSQVRTLSVDGAPGDIAMPGSTRLRGRGRALVSSPVEGSEVYALAGSVATDLTSPERTLPELPDGLTSLTYVG